MSSESSGPDNFSSTEDIELKEFSRSSNGYSDSGSSTDFTASGRLSTNENQTEEDEVNDVFTTSLNTSDEKHHEFDFEGTSLSSLEGISRKDLNRTKKSSTDRKANALTRKAPSLEGFSIQRISSEDPLDGLPARMASSLDPLQKPATISFSPVDPLEGPPPRMASSLDPLDGPPPRMASSLDLLDGPPSRMASSLDSLKKPSTGSHLSLDSLERHPPRIASFLDCLEEHKSRIALSLDPLKEPASGNRSSLDSLKGNPPSLASSLDSLKGPPPSMTSSLDSLKGPPPSMASLDSLERFSAQWSSSLGPLKRSATRRTSSMNPLEGPSTQTVWFSDSETSSVSKICESNNAELETNQHFHDVAASEEDGCYYMIFICLITFLMPYTRQIRHSTYFPLLYVALLAIPCSVAYMSSRYMEMCHYCIRLPLLVWGLGLGGMAMIIIQILSILSKRYFAPPLTGRELKYWMAALALPFYLFLPVEMATLYLCDPDFIPSAYNASSSSSKFCIKIFYDYTYYLNIIVVLVHVLLMLIHVPGWHDPAEFE